MTFASLLTHPGFVNSLVYLLTESIPLLAQCSSWSMTRLMMAMMASASDIPEDIKSNVLSIIVVHADDIDPEVSSEEGLKLFFSSLIKDITNNPGAMELIIKLEDVQPIENYFDVAELNARLNAHVEH